MNLQETLKNADEHKKLRIGSLVHQIKQVKSEIHDAVDKIQEGVEKAQGLESEIREKKSLTSKNLTAAVLLAQDAESKLRILSTNELYKLSLDEHPSKGLEALIKCCVYLLANVVPLIEVNSDKQPRDTSWRTCQKLLRGGKAFIEGFCHLRKQIDNMDVVHPNFECVKLILGESFFDFEHLVATSETISNIYSYIQDLVSYYDLMYVSKAAEKDTTQAAIQLEMSSAQLLRGQEEIQKLQEVSDQLYNELAKATAEP